MPEAGIGAMPIAGSRRAAQTYVALPAQDRRVRIRHARRIPQPVLQFPRYAVGRYCCFRLRKTVVRSLCFRMLSDGVMNMLYPGYFFMP